MMAKRCYTSGFTQEAVSSPLSLSKLSKSLDLSESHVFMISWSFLMIAFHILAYTQWNHSGIRTQKRPRKIGEPPRAYQVKNKEESTYITLQHGRSS